MLLELEWLKHAVARSNGEDRLRIREHVQCERDAPRNLAHKEPRGPTLSDCEDAQFENDIGTAHLRDRGCPAAHLIGGNQHCDQSPGLSATSAQGRV